MTDFDEIERLLADLEQIPATNDNLDAIDGMERELMSRLAGLDVADERVRALTERAIDTMTGTSARIELEDATVDDFRSD